MLGLFSFLVRLVAQVTPAWCAFRPLRRMVNPAVLVLWMSLTAILLTIASLRLGASALARTETPSPTERDRDYAGSDAPVMPAQPFDYVTVSFPSHVPMAELEQADNTPSGNAVTNEGAALGRVLFYDKQLSRNNTVSCASCHHQSAGFSDPRPLSSGIDGGQTTRNAMSLANLRFTNVKGMRPGLFWDERAPTLEEQALMPIQDETEMGMDLGDLEMKLKQLAYYPPLFEAAFGSGQITRERVARALAQFLRSMVTFGSKFDRAAPPSAVAGEYNADFAGFTAQENLGKSLFVNGVRGVAEFGCAFCHVPPTFGMPKAMNNGLELNYRDHGLGVLARPSNDPFTPSNEAKFKAPSLRNIEQTAPYMHDGRFKTLEEVVEHYSGGVRPHQNLALAFDEQDQDRGISGFKFTAEQKAALVAFLKTLTDPQFLSDPRFSDPFARPDTQSGAQDPTQAAREYKRLIDESESGAAARELAGQFIELADRHRTDPVAIDALVWVLTKVRSRPEAIRALELLRRDHLQSDKLGAVCSHIARVPSQAAEELLRAALANSRHIAVRAQACLQLATFLDQQASVLDQLLLQPELAGRLLQYYSKDYASYLKMLSREKLDKEREQVYKTMLKSFADLPTDDSTMGETASKAIFRIRYLSIGRVAPEIEGEDIFGDPFKLSDYRGKVVVISFWGHW
jgi:cytochrome c peroxidase